MEKNRVIEFLENFSNFVLVEVVLRSPVLVTLVEALHNKSALSKFMEEKLILQSSEAKK